jgi:hypothetical protein
MSKEIILETVEGGQLSFSIVAWTHKATEYDWDEKTPVANFHYGLRITQNSANGMNSDIKIDLIDWKPGDYKGVISLLKKLDKNIKELDKREDEETKEEQNV